MTLKKKIWRLSFVFAGLGAILLFIGKMMGGYAGFYVDGRGLHSIGENREESICKDEKKLEEFERIEIEAEYADVRIIPSDHFGVEYCMTGNRKKLVCEVSDGKFTFREEQAIQLIGFEFHFGFFVGTEEYYVNVYVPRETVLSSVDIVTEDGNIELGNLKVDSLTMKNEYGDVEMEGFQGKALKAVLESGNLTAHHVKAKEIEIKDEYGDVYLALEDMADEYSLDLETEYGRIRAPGYGMTSDGDSMMYQTKEGDRTIKISCEDGNIEVVEE